MKAYTITWDRKRPSPIDAKCRYNLPQLECRVCTPQWNGWGAPSISFPAFKFSFFNSHDFNLDRIVSLAEFKKLRERIARAAGRRVIVEPGAGIGELEGTATSTKLDDFTWGRVVLPEMSRQTRDILADDGIELLTADCSISCRGKTIETQLAVQFEPVELLTEESLERHKIFHCPRCGNYQAPLRPAPVVPEGYVIKRSAWPKGGHLVQVRETSDIIASEEFMEAVKKHSLTGIVFKECGQFV